VGLGIIWSVFQLYTAQAGLFDLMIQLPVHVAFAVALGFLATPIPESAAQAEKLRAHPRHRWLDGFCALVALACGAYYIAENDRLTTRMAMVDDPATTDVIIGIVFILLLLEASRRHIGPALVVLALAFVAYAFAGPWLPGFLSHGGETFLKLARHPHARGRTDWLPASAHASVGAGGAAGGSRPLDLPGCPQ